MTRLGSSAVPIDLKTKFSSWGTRNFPPVSRLNPFSAWAQLVSHFDEGHCKPVKRAAADAVAFRMPLVLGIGGGNPTM